ncbi:iron-sulfur cluster assembly scaffold protein [Mycoplasma leonicaptivi]|uniref:iron-sulfur cluster assembly scaffold protein n=1 Tax=Mycoplasma leonicaptivi TaxID=36742 RepID=UPI000489F756|nr:iron-sulfur cluster scaffold-like protein [Mycoplasma leonicaptivi]
MRFNPNQAREIIMNHYLKPQNKTNLLNPQLTFYSSSCSDKLILDFKWENEILQDIKFDGNGCSIFLASADIFINQIIGKNYLEITNIIQNFEDFLNFNEIEVKEDFDFEKLGELWTFFNVKKHLNRVNCAMLLPSSLKSIIDEKF